MAKYKIVSNIPHQLLILLICVVLPCSIGCQATAANKSDQNSIAIKSIKLLSQRGSTRAAFYSLSNKIITIDGKTHVAWLDSVSDTMVATYDHASGNWTEPAKVGTGRDNHGGPALTCDSEGYLHIIFGPHFIDPFHYSRSTLPNNSTSWTAQYDFGINATYPSMVCDNNNTLHVIYRKDHSKLYYQRLPAGGNWSEPVTLASGPLGYNEKDYANFSGNLLIDSDNTLHVGYSTMYYDSSGRRYLTGYMTSADGGDNWTLADGTSLDLPVFPDDDVYFRKPGSRVKGMAFDKQGNPWISLMSGQLWHYNGLQWSSFSPEDRVVAGGAPGLELGPISIDSQGRIYMIATTTDDVVLIYSLDQGQSFKVLNIFPKDVTKPHIVGLSIERPTVNHSVDIPWLMFCMGPKGSDCIDRGIFHDVRAVQLIEK